VIVANAKDLTWQRIDLDEWHKGWESQGWRIVDAAWLTWMEGKVRNSGLWKKTDAESNDYLGRIIAWLWRSGMNLKRRTPLKRTAMKPSQSQLKRTGIKRGKPVSQRKNREVSVIKAYMEAHPFCEFEATGAYTGPGGHFNLNGEFEPHHTARIKCDDKRILVSLCTNCHNLHDIHDPSFVVICLWVKMQTGLLDLPFLSTKFRGGDIVQYIQRDHDWICEEIIDMRDAVLRHAGECE
jgi:hypothetical protein